MNTRDTFGRNLALWLREDAEQRVPDHLGDVLAETATTRQRAWWSSPERWLPMDLTTHHRTVAPPGLGRALVVALVIISIAAVMLAVVGSRQQRLPPPYGPAANGVIFYADGGDIFAADPDAANRRIVIGGPEDDVAVAALPDGARIGIVRATDRGGYHLLTARPDGTDVMPLTRTPLTDLTAVDTSPNGMTLVLHLVVGRPTLSVVATDGSGPLRDLGLGDLVPDAPLWRPPDGREIVFRGYRDEGWGLYAISPDGTGLRALAPIVPTSVADQGYSQPRLSPDGSRATYWHNTVLPAKREDTGEDRKSEVHVLDLQTGQSERIGYDPVSRHELLPKFSPDGRSVLFVRFPRVDDASLLIAAADGSDLPRQIGPHQLWCCNAVFDFSPDGSKVALSFGEGRPLQVIDIATNAVEVGGPADFASWQRLALPG
jgi:hypothetical protein